MRARKEATSAAEHVMARAVEEGGGMVGGGGRGTVSVSSSFTLLLRFWVTVEVFDL